METVKQKKDLDGHTLSDIRAEKKEFTNRETNKVYTRNVYTCYDADAGEKVQFLGGRVLDDQYNNHRINLNVTQTIGQHISRRTGHVYWEFAPQKPPKAERRDKGEDTGAAFKSSGDEDEYDNQEQPEKGGGI